MRIRSAKSPATTKDRIPVVMYMIPISLWSVLVNHMLMGFQNVSS